MKKFLSLLMLFTIGVPVYAGKGHSKESLDPKENELRREKELKRNKVLMNLNALGFSLDFKNNERYCQDQKTPEEKQKKKSNKK